MTDAWYKVGNVADIASPALLVYPDRIAANLRRMVEIVGDPGRLRPHVKTHKLPEIIRMHLELGINKFKCATIAECEMVAIEGAGDVLLAHQPTGPNIERLLELSRAHPNCRFSTIADDAGVVDALSACFGSTGMDLPVYLDVDCSMHRTGIVPGEKAMEICQKIETAGGLVFAGLHVYDGHNHEPDLGKRTERFNADLGPVLEFRSQLEAAGLSVQSMVAGGSPTFPLHARHDDRDCSPGTTVLWDCGYGGFEDLDFQMAAVLLTRVISKPGPNRLCLDLGHKAIAADKPQPRARLLEIPDANLVVHSEEHLMVETDSADKWSVGDATYAVPAHICPTVALHDEVHVVDSGDANSRWKVTARQRQISI